MKSLSVFAITSLCLGSAANAIPMPLPQGSAYADCVADVGREGCAALAMAWSLCRKRIDENRKILMYIISLLRGSFSLLNFILAFFILLIDSQNRP